MSAIDLLTPILENGIRNVNFFNGRLLSAEDLSAEQAANRRRQELLGKAVGEGVAYGLEVKLSADQSPTPKTTPLLKVSAGLGMNRNGQTLHLPADATIALVPEEEEQAAAAGLFASCVPVKTDLFKTGTGVYILAIAPASGFDGAAPMSGLGDTPGAGRACGKRYAVEGVQFRLVEMNINTVTGISDSTRADVLDLMDMNDAASLSKLRNLLAHLCFGTEELANFPRDPFKQTADGTSSFLTYGAIDALRQKNKLTDCDVPLALIYWTTDGVEFVDMWPVRRRLVKRNTSPARPLETDNRRQAEAEAMFLQFQEHLAAIADLSSEQSALGSLIASDYFRYLPPAGIAPITASYIQEYQKAEGAKPISIFTQSRGLYPPKFFDGLTTRKPVFIEGARIESLLNIARHYPPIDLTSEEFVWIYLVRENVETIANQLLTPPQQAYLVFANGNVPFMAEARFNLARWDYSNFV